MLLRHARRVGVGPVHLAIDLSRAIEEEHADGADVALQLLHRSARELGVALPGIRVGELAGALLLAAERQHDVEAASPRFALQLLCPGADDLGARLFAGDLAMSRAHEGLGRVPEVDVDDLRALARTAPLGLELEGSEILFVDGLAHGSCPRRGSCRLRARRLRRALLRTIDPAHPLVEATRGEPQNQRDRPEESSHPGAGRDVSGLHLPMGPVGAVPANRVTSSIETS